MTRAARAYALQCPGGRGPPCARARSVRRRSRSSLRCFCSSPAPAARRRPRRSVQPCDLGVPTSGGDGVTISSPALECAGGICLQVGSGPALCSSECGSDDDCGNPPRAATRAAGMDSSAPPPPRWARYACRRLCVCLDMLSAPPACEAGAIAGAAAFSLNFSGWSWSVRPRGYSFSHFLKSGNSSALIFGSSISSRAHQRRAGVDALLHHAAPQVVDDGLHRQVAHLHRVLHDGARPCGPGAAPRRACPRCRSR